MPPMTDSPLLLGLPFERRFTSMAIPRRAFAKAVPPNGKLPCSAIVVQARALLATSAPKAASVTPMDGGLSESSLRGCLETTDTGPLVLPFETVLSASLEVGTSLLPPSPSDSSFIVTFQPAAYGSPSSPLHSQPRSQPPYQWSLPLLPHSESARAHTSSSLPLLLMRSPKALFQPQVKKKYTNLSYDLVFSVVIASRSFSLTRYS
ncbi:hypothetical protein X975_03333, partial [Stegodyphus mimosarum]